MNNNIIYIIFILLSALKMKVYKPIHTHTRTFSLSHTHTDTCTLSRTQTHANIHLFYKHDISSLYTVYHNWKHNVCVCFPFTWTLVSLDSDYGLLYFN